MNNFLALDVETANAKRASICFIGLVFFEDGQVVDRKHYLINPQEEFLDSHIKIHGISPHRVRRSPTFPQIEPQLRSLLTNQAIVSHTKFDLQAIKSVLKKYHLPPILYFTWIDSCEVAKELWPNLQNHKLKTVAKHLGISFDHHNAVEDAYAAGMIIVKRNKTMDHPSLSQSRISIEKRTIPAPKSDGRLVSLVGILFLPFSVSVDLIKSILNPQSRRSSLILTGVLVFVCILCIVASYALAVTSSYAQ